MTHYDNMYLGFKEDEEKHLYERWEDAGSDWEDDDSEPEWVVKATYNLIQLYLGNEFVTEYRRLAGESWEHFRDDCADIFEVFDEGELIDGKIVKSDWINIIQEAYENQKS